MIKIKNNSRSFITLIVTGVIFLVLTGGSMVQAQDLNQILRDDGKQEAYYAAGNEFLVVSFDLIDRYWSKIAKTDKSLLRGHLDNYLPFALKQLEHKPAQAMMRSFATSFFSVRNPNTGLIPFSYDSPIDQSSLTTGDKQPVGLVAKGIDFCQWFPDDQKLQNKCVQFATATINYFDFELESGKKGGMWGWVDTKSGGEPRVSVTLTLDYGAVAKGLAYLSQRTADPKFLIWADQKLEFVWQNRMNQELPLLEDQFIPTGANIRPDEASSDTDTLYYVRQLFELYDLTGEQKYRDWAIAVTDLWFEKAWNPQWGHFIRKLNPDGTPAVDTLYGDGKYNTLYILVHAYRVTKDSKYIERFKQAWSNLLEMGKDGFVPEMIKQGKMVDLDGLDLQQTIFLDVLVKAYEASGNKEFLQQAEALGTRILTQGETLMRIEGGQAGEAFLRLALAQQKIQRLEIAMGTTGKKLQVTRQGEKILEVIVPAEFAIVYLPEDAYEIEVTNEQASQKKHIRLDSNQKMNFSSISGHSCHFPFSG